MNKKNYIWILLAIFSSLQGFSLSNSTQDLASLSLEELMQIEIVSSSRKSERAFEVPAAVFVINREDIRRSGATSLPDLFRMVPGFHVARINANRWAVTSRGFNGVFASKLQVLVDGRSVYTPLFSGVYWDVQDMLLEDIERIEVIRGPGASVWGANAVNGVVNIITRHSRDTHGGLVTLAGGSQEHGIGAARIGGELGDNGHYRVHSRFFQRDTFVGSSGLPSVDDGRLARGGFRIDLQATSIDSMMVQGDLYTGRFGRRQRHAMLTPPYSFELTGQTSVSGGFLQSRWERTMSPRSQTAFQVYYDRSERENPLSSERRDTVDFDFQHHYIAGKRHDLVWGAGYRFSLDDYKGSFSFSLREDRPLFHLFSGFIQDEIRLIDDRLFLTLGSKIERNSYSGTEIQPTARLLWVLNERQNLWGAVSRATGLPSRAHTEGIINAAAFPSRDGTLSLLRFLGDEQILSEKVLTYEVGYRNRVRNNLFLDIATFFNRYDDLTTWEPHRPFFEAVPAPPHLVIPFQAHNLMSGKTYGAEIYGRWSPDPTWNLSAGYTWLRVDLLPDLLSQDTETAQVAGTSPQHQWHARSSVRLLPDLELNTALYYVGQLTSPESVPSYVKLDTRLNWFLLEHLGLSLVMSDLVDDRHPEFPGGSGIEGTQVQRSVYGKLTWLF